MGHTFQTRHLVIYLGPLDAVGQAFVQTVSGKSPPVVMGEELVPTEDDAGESAAYPFIYHFIPFIKTTHISIICIHTPSYAII